MPANFSDSPATREQYETYLRDPNDPHGKDYSSKQKASNEASKGACRYYHKNGTSQIFMREEIDRGLSDEWKDSPWVKEVAKTTEPDPTPSAELDVLRSECDRLGIKYHYRAGITRLSELIANHKE